MTEGFAALGLSRDTLQSMNRAKQALPTPLQMKVIPPALLGRDIVAVSSPGSGRTTAFLLAMIERLGGLAGTRALILARTKQRIQEVHEQFKVLSQGRPFKVTEILSNGSLSAQEQELRERRPVLLSMPQRLTEHMDKGAVNFSSIEMVILDAADDMVTDGLLAQMKRIVTRLPPRRQTMIFTRTLTSELGAFARTYLRDPIMVEVPNTEPSPVPAEAPAPTQAAAHPAAPVKAASPRAAKAKPAAKVKPSASRAKPAKSERKR